MTKKLEVPPAARDATVPEKADAAVARAFADYQDSPIVRAIAAVGKVGDQPPLRALSGAVLAAGLLRRDRQMVRAGLRMLAAHTLATAAKNVVKRRVDRTRPNVLVKEGRYNMKRGRKRSKAETSFPSGHSAGAMAVGCAFAREFPDHRVAALTAAGLVALAQIPRCAHYPTDVGAGSLIGILSDAAVASVA